MKKENQEPYFLVLNLKIYLNYIIKLLDINIYSHEKINIKLVGGNR